MQGIVSRVTMARYAYASNKLLGIQIDAAINPGQTFSLPAMPGIPWDWRDGRKAIQTSCRIWPDLEPALVDAWIAAFFKSELGLCLREPLNTSFSRLVCTPVFTLWSISGNSGGPAFSNLEEGTIGGVAFSKLTHAGDSHLIPSHPSSIPLHVQVISHGSTFQQRHIQNWCQRHYGISLWSASLQIISAMSSHHALWSISWKSIGCMGAFAGSALLRSGGKTWRMSI